MNENFAAYSPTSVSNYIKVNTSPLEAMRTQGDVDARVHIFAATAIGRGGVINPMFGHLYPQ